MRWFTKHLRNVSIACAGVLFLLTCLALIPLSAASAHAGASGMATPTTVTVQATSTEDATVTALSKKQLAQQVSGQQHTWDNWIWSNLATILSSFLSTLVIVIGALFGLWRWRADRKDAQDKELKDRKNARENRAEERFQTVVEGLGREREEAKVGAAIMLRTFLQQGYEQFYRQTFDLAVAHLRLPRTLPLSEEDLDALHAPPSSSNPNIPLPLTTLSQALITVFKEAFSLARDRLKEANSQFNPQLLDASHILLDNAYLSEADLAQVWMPYASIRCGNLSRSNLSEANLRGANFTLAKLEGANFSKADLSHANFTFTWLKGANFSKADLSHANFSHIVFGDVNLSEAILDEAVFCEADFYGANLSGVKFWLTNLSKAKLFEADLSDAELFDVDLSGADLSRANLSRANLRGANLSGTNLRGANLSGVKQLEEARSLKKTDLRRAKELTKEQLDFCKAKGAILDEDPTTCASQPTAAPASPPQSNDTQTPLAPSPQESTPLPDPDGSNTASSQQGSEA